MTSTIKFAGSPPDKIRQSGPERTALTQSWEQQSVTSQKTASTGIRDLRAAGNHTVQMDKVDDAPLRARAIDLKKRLVG